MENENSEVKELVVIENNEIIEKNDNSENNNNISQIKPFPLCLLSLNSYTGVKALFGIFFWISFLYFCYGIIHFFIWDTSFGGFFWNLFTKPISLFYHICVFSFMYCLTWAIFDLSSFKNSLIRFLLIIASILYLVSPVDVIPDLTPFIGYADDLIAIILALFNAFSLINNKGDSNTIRKVATLSEKYIKEKEKEDE